ncbi:MAG: NADPH:quinone oxidoreductase family protein [Myxococcales bacterium]|jgi:NADPH2:quinone reductase
MKAIQVKEYGDPSAVSVVEVEDRAPSAHEVKMRVHGVGIGYFDGLLIKGEYQIKPPLPFIPGSSLSGVVEAVGDAVTHLQPGDHVAGFSLLGGLAEYACLPANFVFKIPESIPLDDAANFLIAYSTAVLGLAELAKTKRGEQVLVLGASGTTGSTAIDVARALGAKVIACASTEQKRAHCLERGADVAVDYTRPEWRNDVKAATGGRGVDVVFDPVGGDLAEPALRSMAPHGRYLVVGFVAGIPRVPLNWPLIKRCSIMGVNWGGEVFASPGVVQPVIDQIVRWAAEGKLQASPDAIYPLNRAGEAFASLFARTSRGTIVVRC